MKKLLYISLLLSALPTIAGCTTRDTTETVEHPKNKYLNSISLANTGKGPNELRVDLDELNRKAIENPGDIMVMGEYRNLQSTVLEIATEYAQQPENSVVEEDVFYELF